MVQVFKGNRELLRLMEIDLTINYVDAEPLVPSNLAEQILVHIIP